MEGKEGEKGIWLDEPLIPSGPGQAAAAASHGPHCSWLVIRGLTRESRDQGHGTILSEGPRPSLKNNEKNNTKTGRGASQLLQDMYQSQQT